MENYKDGDLGGSRDRASDAFPKDDQEPEANDHPGKVLVSEANTLDQEDTLAGERLDRERVSALQEGVTVRKDFVPAEKNFPGEKNPAWKLAEEVDTEKVEELAEEVKEEVQEKYCEKVQEEVVEEVKEKLEEVKEKLEDVKAGSEYVIEDDTLKRSTSNGEHLLGSSEYQRLREEPESENSPNLPIESGKIYEENAFVSRAAEENASEGNIEEETFFLLVVPGEIIPEGNGNPTSFSEENLEEEARRKSRNPEFKQEQLCLAERRFAENPEDFPLEVLLSEFWGVPGSLLLGASAVHSSVFPSFDSILLASEEGETPPGGSGIERGQKENGNGNGNGKGKEKETTCACTCLPCLPPIFLKIVSCCSCCHCFFPSCESEAEGLVPISEKQSKSRKSNRKGARTKTIWNEVAVLKLMSSIFLLLIASALTVIYCVPADTMRGFFNVNVSSGPLQDIAKPQKVADGPAKKTRNKKKSSKLSSKAPAKKMRKWISVKRRKSVSKCLSKVPAKKFRKGNLAKRRKNFSKQSIHKRNLAIRKRNLARRRKNFLKQPSKAPAKKIRKPNLAKRRKSPLKRRSEAPLEKIRKKTNVEPLMLDC